MPERLSVRAGSFAAEVVADRPLPAAATAFCRALDRLVPDEGARTVLELRLVDDRRALAEARRGFARAGEPRSERLRRLPSGRRAQVREGADGAVYLDWADAALLAAPRRAGSATLHHDGARRHLAWMVSYLVATTHTRLGACRALHASAVRLNGRNVLVVGAARWGKTTLVLALTELGGELLTDDVTYVDAHGRFVPLPLRDYMTIRAGTHAAFAALLDARLGSAVKRPPAPAGVDAGALHALGRSGQWEAPLAAFAPREPVHAPQQPHLVAVASVSPADTGASLGACEPPETVGRLPAAMIDWTSELLRDPPPAGTARALRWSCPVAGVRFGIGPGDAREAARLVAGALGRRSPPVAQQASGRRAQALDGSA